MIDRDQLVEPAPAAGEMSPEQRGGLDPVGLFCELARFLCLIVQVSVGFIYNLCKMQIMRLLSDQICKNVTNLLDISRRVCYNNINAFGALFEGISDASAMWFAGYRASGWYPAAWQRSWRKGSVARA